MAVFRFGWGVIQTHVGPTTQARAKLPSRVATSFKHFWPLAAVGYAQAATEFIAIQLAPLLPRILPRVASLALQPWTQWTAPGLDPGALQRLHRLGDRLPAQQAGGVAVAVAEQRHGALPENGLTGRFADRHFGAGLLP